MKRLSVQNKKKFLAEVELFRPHLEIEKEILNDTFREEKYEAYADWLKQNGQTFLAELINSESSAYPTDTNSVEVIFGEYLTTLSTSIKSYKGFAYSVTLLESGAAGQLLQKLFSRPIARLLREIRVNESMNFKDSVADFVHTIAKWERISNLKSLAIEACDESNSWTQSSPLGDLGELLKKASELEYLYLKGSSVQEFSDDDIYAGCQTRIGALNLPHLRKYTRRASDFTFIELDQLLNSQVPLLEELVLIGGEESELEPTHFQKLFQSNICKNLKSIGLCRFKNSIEILRKLFASPLIENIEFISFEGGDLSDESIELIELNKDSFKRFKKINFSSNIFTDEVADRLKKLNSKLRISNQRASFAEEFYQDALYQEAYDLKDEKQTES